MERNKKIICFDFDGVIATYDKWKGVDKLGKPIKSVIKVMRKLKKENYFILIYTTRIITKTLLNWLSKYKVPYDAINTNWHNPSYTSFKPIYDCIVDDRAINPVNEDKETLYYKIKSIANKEYDKKGEITGKWSLLIGRYQPPHEGHFKLIKKVLKEGNKVCIGLRKTPINKKNPLTIEERKKIFEKVFKKEIKKGKLQLIKLPDIKEVVYGRKVGWSIRQIRLDKKTESISATEIRKNFNKNNYL